MPVWRRLISRIRQCLRWEGGAGWQRTNDAYLQADITPISAKVTGYVRELPIQDYEHVRKGQVLVQLVDEDYRAAVAQADAGVATAVSQAQALKAQRELQLANVEAARAVVASIIHCVGIICLPSQTPSWANRRPSRA